MRDGQTERHHHTGTQVCPIAWGTVKAALPIPDSGRGACCGSNPDVRPRVDRGRYQARGDEKAFALGQERHGDSRMPIHIEGHENE